MDDRPSRIVDVVAWECLDSRGNPTVACEVELADGTRGLGIAPAGASTGEHEALERRDGGDRLAGLGVRGAVESVRTRIAPQLRGLPADRRDLVDRTLRELDGPRPGGVVGANATIATSLAVWLALARSRRVEPFQVISHALDREPLLPMPMVNILSGGLHAGRAMDVQDVLVLPSGADTVEEALEWAGEIRRRAAAIVEQRGGSPTLVADEGGLALPGATTEVALELVLRAIAAAGLEPGEQVAIALDVAAGTFWSPETGTYQLAAERRSVAPGDWLKEVEGWCEGFPLASVEDPITDSDWEAWTALHGRVGDRVQLLGDDLFVTDVERVRRGHASGAANAVLVKPNQAGTLAEAEAVIAAAGELGMAAVVSARSGETEQSWLADLAVGAAGGQIKVGSMTRSERAAKWNRLLQIAATHRLPFAGARLIAPLAP